MLGLTRSHDGKPQRDEIATARVQSVVRLVGAGLGITAGTAILVFKNANGVSRSVVHMGWKGAVRVTLFACVCTRGCGGGGGCRTVKVLRALVTLVPPLPRPRLKSRNGSYVLLLYLHAGHITWLRR